MFIGTLSAKAENSGKIQILPKTRGVEGNRYAYESGKFDTYLFQREYLICIKRLKYLLKKRHFCYLISDDTHDGTTSSPDNGPSKDDEWPGNEKRDGTNAPKYECSKSGEIRNLKI